MKTFYRRFSIVFGFALLLAVLIGNAFFTQRELDVQIGLEGWVFHTRQVLYELTETESLLKDAETGQRGFLYTGDQKYLVPYDAAVGQVQAHLDAVARLTADNLVQQSRIPLLRKLVNDKLNELVQTISLYRSGRQSEAKAVVLSDAGLATMDDIRLVITQMRHDEASLETQRIANYKKSTQATRRSIYLATCFAVLGLLFLANYILREIGLREKHTRELRAREEWFRVTLTSIGDAVIATDGQGRVTFMNPIAEKLTGFSMAQSKLRNIQEVFPIFNEVSHQPAENPVKRVMELGRVVGLANHTVLENSDGSLTPIEDSAAPIRGDDGKLLGVVLVFRDVTAERKSQEVLRKTERLAAASRLSATVAHEINNPLEAVVNLIYIAKNDPGMPKAAAHYLAMAEDELERVAHITRKTLGFYRDRNAPEEVNMPALIESVLGLYSNKFMSKNIEIKLNFGECPALFGLQGELQQAVSNLIANAADAVEVGGTITLTLRSVEEAGRRVVHLKVEDDGPGIDAAHAGRIFEPFFTTKPDVGTGLGLWLTREIVNRHGGRIEVDPRREGSGGAAFSILLPLGTDAHFGNGEESSAAG